MAQTNLNISEVVQSLGGNPRSDEHANLELLANEIIILRQKLIDAQDAEGRCERRLGGEIEARGRAERRAEIAEGAISQISQAISRAEVEATAAGAPFTYLRRTPDEIAKA